MFFKMVHAAFGQRRKTASNAISSGMGVAKDVVIRAIEECGFEPAVRAETMDMAQLAMLSDKIVELLRNN
jgi:16S rRNA (adenine1518-N6/adenine1519-N6)-dimethyltransferase